MMIYLSPQFNALPALALSVAGDTITINGEDLDLSPMEDGDTLDAEAVDTPYIQEAIRKEAGVLHVTVLFPLRYGAPDEAKSPVPITVTEDGPVTLPPNGDVP
jgi:hypothetical protein